MTASTTTNRNEPNAVAQSAYAIIGFGDQMMERLRTMSDSDDDVADRLRTQVQDWIDSGREALSEWMNSSRETFKDYAEHGRGVYQRLRSNDDVQEAVTQGKQAKAATKGAVTTARRSGKQTSGAAQRAATMTSKAASTSAEAAKSATERLGNGATARNTPFEDRTRDELYELATERDLHGRSSMTKDELIAALRS